MDHKVLIQAAREFVSEIQRQKSFNRQESDVVLTFSERNATNLLTVIEALTELAEEADKWVPTFEHEIDLESQLVKFKVTMNGKVANVAVSFLAIRDADLQTLVSSVVKDFAYLSWEPFSKDAIADTVSKLKSNVTMIMKSGAL